MVEFSIFYFLPPPPLFVGDFPAEKPHIYVGFNFAQIDNYQKVITPEGLPRDFSFPVAFKLSNGMRFKTHVFWEDGWKVFLSLPHIHTSTPALGTSSLSSGTAPLLWKDVDFTVEDTLLPVEVDGLRAKTPVLWRVKGSVKVLPSVSSKSSVSYVPLSLLAGRRFGGYFFEVATHVARISGKGGWEILYESDEIMTSDFKLEGDNLKNEAVFLPRIGEDRVGRYVYTFEMQPEILYSIGLLAGREFGNLTLGLGLVHMKDVRFTFDDSLLYDFVEGFEGDWRRDGFESNDLRAEYSKDGDTLYVKGSSIVEFLPEKVVWGDGSSKGRKHFYLRGFTSPILVLRYGSEVFGGEVRVGKDGFYARLMAGREYGGFAGADIRFEDGLLSSWWLGAFYSSEGFGFFARISRAFGRVEFPYVEYEIPFISGEIYSYSLGIGFIWRMGYEG